jgi:hypothetical protein
MQCTTQPLTLWRPPDAQGRQEARLAGCSSRRVRAGFATAHVRSDGSDTRIGSACRRCDLSFPVTADRSGKTHAIDLFRVHGNIRRRIEDGWHARQMQMHRNKCSHAGGNQAGTCFSRRRIQLLISCCGCFNACYFYATSAFKTKSLAGHTAQVRHPACHARPSSLARPHAALPAASPRGHPPGPDPEFFNLFQMGPCLAWRCSRPTSPPNHRPSSTRTSEIIRRRPMQPAPAMCSPPGSGSSASPFGPSLLVFVMLHHHRQPLLVDEHGRFAPPSLACCPSCAYVQ